MMKRLTLLCLMWMALIPMWAANTVTTVGQVTTAVTLSDDVDYHITSTTPFSEDGSIDIANTEHAVVIIDNVRPSQVQTLLRKIKINGVQASLNVNCQLKIYNNGTLILPYGTNTKPLTVYSEKNFAGDSSNDFDLRNTGGYMNTLTTAQLNNRIQSFKLKRGYMVTFSLSANGRGYSRCFIASDSDLEMNLPLLMANRISSYRIFKWQDTSKKGLANDTGSGSNSALNTQWCYSFGMGENGGLDRECTPHHIYEDWPSSSECGSATYSAHMKTNNEPGNSADDHPQDVATVLANWEKLMATGMRLCSPSSHDGSLNWLHEFMDSIDARGWRCDILDMHCYWTEGKFNELKNWYDRHRRPIWVSEFVWGASWSGGSGAFVSGVTEAKNAEVMARILQNMNNMPYVERYAYWNSERDPSRVYKNGSLTQTGEYFRDMNTGLGYNASYNYVPTTPRTYAPVITSSSFQPSNMKFTMKWEQKNGELADSVVIERKDAANADWKAVYVYPRTEKAASYTFTETVEKAGTYTYRVAEHLYNNKVLYSEEAYNVVSGADGTEVLQYGTLSAESTDAASVYMKNAFDENPAVVTGGTSYKNTTLTPVENIAAINKNGYFTFNYFPFTVTTADQTFTSAENTSYIIAKTGHGTIGTLAYEAGPITGSNGRAQRISTDTVRVTFKEPFATTPIVMASPYQNVFSYPVTCRVFDITTEGFKIILQRQEGITDAVKPNAMCSYFAIEQGQTQDENNKLITVRSIDYSTPVLLRNVVVNYDVEEDLQNPFVLAQLQSLHHSLMTLIRIANVRTTSAVLRLQADASATNATFSNRNPYQEKMAIIVISDGKETDGIRQPSTPQGSGSLLVFGDPAANAIGVKDPAATAVTLYNAHGQKLMTQPLTDGQATLNISTLPTGVYILRSNANHSTKIVKK